MRGVRAGLVTLVIACFGLGLASCGGSKPASISSQIRQWSLNAGFPGLDSALVADFPAVRAGIDAGNLKALKTACAGLSIDAGSIYDTLVTPDHALSEALARALTGIADVGNTCTALRSVTKATTATLRRTLATNEALYRKERAIVLAADGT
ncbi:MAG TPA: hypothetical protein VG368_00215 [Acidimicrobiales bacterium]|jgi:hypothetical protein|nr:hypothetical protein [Acidimicrobiales bacterium]